MTSPFHSQPQLVKLREILSEGGWDKVWLSQVTPWDAGYCQPPLEELFKSGEIAFPRVGRALVPGCGKGYDAISIAKHLGLHVTGVDISPTGITLAQENLKSHHISVSSVVSFEEGDFFKIPDEPTFDLISDYTFFQALPPVLRAAWGTKMNHIVKEDGFLVILAFPTNAHKDIGPPYGIDEDTHASLLGDGWVKLMDRVPTISSEEHAGKDRLIVFQRSRSKGS